MGNIPNMPCSVGNLANRWYVDVPACCLLSVGRPIIALCGESLSTTRNSTIWIALGPFFALKVTGSITFPSVSTLSPEKLKRGVRTGEVPIPPKLILSKASLKKMSAVLPLLTRTFFTKLLAAWLHRCGVYHSLCLFLGEVFGPVQVAFLAMTSIT